LYKILQQIASTKFLGEFFILFKKKIKQEKTIQVPEKPVRSWKKTKTNYSLRKGGWKKIKKSVPSSMQVFQEITESHKCCLQRSDS